MKRDIIYWIIGILTGLIIMKSLHIFDFTQFFSSSHVSGGGGGGVV